MKLRLLTWNLFHGRDFPPGLEGGFGWKFLGRPVLGEEHVLVNRNLFVEFAAFLAAARWDVAMLQEVPPRWARSLARATRSQALRTLTSRNWLRPFTFMAARPRPHLPGSWEGGSNLILVRGRRRLGERRSMTLSWYPERRTATVVGLSGGLMVANLHASTGKGAEVDVLRAAALAVTRAAGAPLVLAGDFNARPRSSDVFDRLERDFGLTGISGPGAIDHILVRGVPEADPAVIWAPGRRDVPDGETGLLIRLSDHAPVTRDITVTQASKVRSNTE